MTLPVLVKRTKDNLIIDHDEDNVLIEGYIRAAVNYAERFQHKPTGYYSDNLSCMSPLTEQAIIFLASHFYESRDGSSGGIFPDRYSGSAPSQAMHTAERLLRMDKEAVF